MVDRSRVSDSEKAGGRRGLSEFANNNRVNASMSVASRSSYHGGGATEADRKSDMLNDFENALSLLRGSGSQPPKQIHH